MSSALPSEEWNKFVSGDISTFRRLFLGYYKGLYGYGYKLCRDAVLVEDSIQELFESVWKRRNELTHVTSPNVYLYVSLRRNLLKKSKKKIAMEGLANEDHEFFQFYFDEEELIIQNESKKEQKKELQKALNQLPKKQKEVIYLHFYNGMSYAEIEKILSINRQSVRNHMYRAMRNLRAVLTIDVMRLVISLMISVLLPVLNFL